MNDRYTTVYVLHTFPHSSFCPAKKIACSNTEKTFHLDRLCNTQFITQSKIDFSRAIPKNRVNFWHYFIIYVNPFELTTSVVPFDSSFVVAVSIKNIIFVMTLTLTNTVWWVLNTAWPEEMNMMQQLSLHLFCFLKMMSDLMLN